MSEFAEYLLTTPPHGPYYGWLVAIAVVAALSAVVARQVARRTGFAAIRRRARRLSVIMVELALLVGLSLVARAAELDILSWRLWLILGGAILLARLAWWALRLRSLPHDKVDERNRQRKQLYFIQRPRRPAKRKRRRPRR